MSTDGQVELVVFDLGRVLVRICDNWQHACRVARVPVPFKDLDEFGKAKLLELVHASEVGRMDQDEFYRHAGELFGVDPAHVALMSDAYLLGTYPGAVELIHELIARGYETACLSNTNVNHWRIMADPTSPCALPFDRMAYHFASQLIGLRKPDDAIYAHVENVSGKRGNQIVFFDDLRENIEGATRRGWSAHQISTERDPVAQMREVLCSLHCLGGT